MSEFRETRVCNASDCGVTFVARRKTMIYCCPQCRWSESSRRYYARDRDKIIARVLGYRAMKKERAART
jgi:ribosomal protein L37AE/L43A